MKQRFTKRTRLVSALLTLAMVFTFLPLSAFADYYVPLNIYTFPNETFREYISTQFDSDDDGILDTAEREAVTEIDVSNKNITTLKGIEYFSKLETLYCNKNKLSSLDVSQNTALTYLDCSENQLTSLEVSDNTNLMMLLCYQNELNSLDVTRNPALITLNCSKNNLTSLDVSKHTALTNLKCSENQLTSLNVSKNDNLETLYCDQNQLTNLDVTQFIRLQELYCFGNQLTELDVRKNAQLEVLQCNKNQLTKLDVSQNTQLNTLYCYQNKLTSLDVSQTAVTTLGVSGKIDINVETTPRTFDLSKLPGFDASRASNWVGGDVDGNTLKVNEGVDKVTYTYDCGKGLSETFTLNVKVVPDGTVTPPSGGGTTTSPEAGKYQLTVTDGVATVNGITRDVLNVKPGDTVTLTADTTKFPENEEFGWWEITPYGSVSNTLTGQYQRTATFTMPSENVSARAMSKSAGVSTGGDDGGGGGGAAILLVGGAAVAGLVGYGVYSYVSEQQLKALLPEGVAMPENRAQTALLLWNTAGRPEPAEAPAFKDVADPDTAKAAQWCVEHGLMDQKLGGRFAPDNSDPAYKTLNAYQQLVG